MSHTLRQLPGQNRLARWLSQAFASDKRSHAYLLLGPEGSGRFRLAMAMAGAALCDEPVDGDACGACRSCRRVESGNHPDLHVYEPPPDKTQFTTEVIEQVNTDVFRRAYEGGAKVFVLKRIERMNTTTANRFLKTLEEPPAGTLFCLLGTSANNLLPTIVSRCQTVRPLPMGLEEIRRILVDEHGYKEDEAAMAASTSGGWLDVALTLDEGLMGEVRNFARTQLAKTTPEQNLDLSDSLRQLCKDTASKGRARQNVIQAVELIRVLWRDALAYKLQGSESPIEAVPAIAGARSEAKLVADLRAFGEAVAALRGNASIEPVLDDLLLRVG